MQKIEDIEFLKKIELLVLDVDGVMTDGKFLLSPNGDEFKPFNAKDGAGIKYWMRTGGTVAIISGRNSNAVVIRAGELGVSFVRQGCKNKAPVLAEIFEESGIDPSATAIMGDDLPDLPMFHMSGISACPSDAVADVRQQADYVCNTGGGNGCVREFIEVILKKTGKWESVMERYLPDNRSQG